MDNFIMLFIGLFILAIVWVIAAYIANLNTKPLDFHKDNYFDLKYGSRLARLIEDGQSEKEAYEEIIVGQDIKIRDQYHWTIFWGIMTIVAAAGFFTKF